MEPLLGLFASGAALLAAAARRPGARKLKKIFDDAWEARLRHNPILATRVGDRRYNDRLPSVSPADYDARLLEARKLLVRLQQVDSALLSQPDAANYRLFDILLRDEVDDLGFQSYLMPLTTRQGFHVWLPDFHNHVPLDTVEDHENYIARLAAVRRYAADHIELMREGIRSRMVVPRVLLEGIGDTFRPHLVADPAQSLFYEPFLKLPRRFAEADRDRLCRLAAGAVSGSVVPGLRDILEFLESEYVTAARATIAAGALPRGKEYYDFCVRRFTTLDVTPEEVHGIGLEEVRRIDAEMEAVPRRAGFTGGKADFIRYLRSDPRFYTPTPDQLLKEVSLVLKRMDGELPRLFGKLPRLPYGIRAIPEFSAPRATTAYYMTPPGDGSRAGTYYVNTYDLKSRPLYEIEALSLHEAVPGHHLQIALAQEMEDLPAFRRFAGFTAFVEGWALYAERLGLETGFYQDAYSDFGRLTYEAWRACRLVVDTGIHALGWSRRQAVDFMAKHTALALHNIETEVDRYISWPGQALAYKMGEIKIRELRRLAEGRLGPRFDLRAFHDAVLAQGAVPLPMLEDMVRRHIEARSAS